MLFVQAAQALQRWQVELAVNLLFGIQQITLAALARAQRLTMGVISVVIPSPNKPTLQYHALAFPANLSQKGGVSQKDPFA